MSESIPSSKPQPESASTASERVITLLRVLEGTTDPAERAQLLVQVALDFRDGLRDQKQALDALVGAWQADPTHAHVLDHLEPLARAESRWNEILETTRVALNKETVPERALAYTEAMVRWLTREVPMPDLALQYLERVRLFDRTHWLLHLFQAAKYEERGDVKGELEELDRAVLSAKRADDRARIHIMMANRYSAGWAANPAEAKKHFLAAHNLMPKSIEAMRGLEQFLSREGDFPALAEILEKQVEASEVEEEQLTLLLRLAEIYEKQFLKLDMAAERLERAFVLDPSRPEILTGLERCYTALRAWDDLARVLDGAIILMDDPQERGERLLALAELYESKVGNFAGALKAYQALDEMMPDDEALVGELARLAEKVGDRDAAVRYRSKLAELAPDAKTRARMHVMAGQLLLSHDAMAARVHFDKAVMFDASNASAWNALLSEARSSGDMPRVAAYLEERALSAEGPRAQAQIYAELGNVKHGLGDGAGAIAAWESAIAADANNELAARGLLGIYVESGRWQEAAPLADLVLHAAEREGDSARLYTARRHASLIAAQVGRHGRALTLALSAFHLRPDAIEAKASLVESAWTMRGDPQVLDALNALGDVASATRSLPKDARAQLGEIFALTGDRNRAIAIFEELLVEQPDNAVALRGLSGLRAARGESIQAWTLKRQLAATLGDEEERFRTLVETADGFAGQAKRSDLAAEVYEQARAIRPKDHVLLHKLLGQYQTMENWPKVFDVLRAIVDSDQDPQRKAKVIMTMGQIAQGKMDDRTTAVALYDEALDCDPARLDGFERIVRILTDLADWRGLERAYQRMRARANDLGDALLQHSLCHQLGLLYRDKLSERESAIAAFRRAVELRPDDEPSQAILRELLAASGHAADAVAMTLERVRRDPLDPTPYGALYDLTAQLGHADRAWCIASVMAHLGASHPNAVAFHRSVHPPLIDQIKGSLGDQGYRSLLHPELDPTLTAIFEVMAAAAVEMHIDKLGFRERLAHPGPPLTQPELLIQEVKGASRILGIPQPRLFLAKMPPAMSVAITRPASLLVHPQSLPGVPRNQLSFWIGKHLMELTPPLLARALFRSISELKELVATAARVVGEVRDPNNRTDDQWRAHIRKERHRELASAVETALAAGALDVRRWSQLADLSTSRAGLVITGDVENARLALMREAQSPGDLGPRDQMRELVGFFLSEGYAHVRAVLGVALR